MNHVFELAGDVVRVVKIGIVENIGENVFGQNVLNYHFPQKIRAELKARVSASAVLQRFHRLARLGRTPDGFAHQLREHRAVRARKKRFGFEREKKNRAEFDVRLDWK